MVDPCSLAPQLKIRVPRFSVSPHRREINKSCLPSFRESSVFTLPESRLFYYLRHVTDFKTPNFRDFHGMHACYSSQKGSHHASVFCWTCSRKAVTRPCSSSQFKKTQSRKPVTKLAVLSQLPCSCAWEQCVT